MNPDWKVEDGAGNFCEGKRKRRGKIYGVMRDDFVILENRTTGNRLSLGSDHFIRIRVFYTEKALVDQIGYYWCQSITGENRRKKSGTYAPGEKSARARDP